MGPMEPPAEVKKKTSGANGYVKELRQAMKHRSSDLAKLSKKMERVRDRLFHTNRSNQSTFVPSAQSVQGSSSASSSSDPPMPHQPVIVSPPYPAYPGMGSGFPPLPTRVQQQVVNPPSYGWTLNGIETSALPPTQSAFGALSLDVGAGDESAGGGYDHLAVHEDPEFRSYLRHDPEQAERKHAQSSKLELVKKRLLDDVKYATRIEQDERELREYYDSKFVHLLVDENAMTTEELEEKVRQLEDKMRRLRAKTPSAGPPPRPPPPRSSSQENSVGPWKCARCQCEHEQNEYRCRNCELPSRRFDPSEVERCRCEYCIPYSVTDQ